MTKDGETAQHLELVDLASNLDLKVDAVEYDDTIGELGYLPNPALHPSWLATIVYGVRSSIPLTR